MHVTKRDDSSSLYRPVGTAPWTTAPVRTERLDAVLEEDTLPTNCLLKIDVQGAELDVLEGAEGILPKVGHILVEVSLKPLYQDQPLMGEVVRWAIRHGYDLVGVGHAQRVDGVAVQVDLLFGPPQDTSREWN